MKKIVIIFLFILGSKLYSQSISYSLKLTPNFSLIGLNLIDSINIDEQEMKILLDGYHVGLNFGLQNVKLFNNTIDKFYNQGYSFSIDQQNKLNNNSYLRKNGDTIFFKEIFSDFISNNENTFLINGKIEEIVTEPILNKKGEIKTDKKTGEPLFKETTIKKDLENEVCWIDFNEDWDIDSSGIFNKNIDSYALGTKKEFDGQLLGIMQAPLILNKHLSSKGNVYTFKKHYTVNFSDREVDNSYEASIMLDMLIHGNAVSPSFLYPPQREELLKPFFDNFYMGNYNIYKVDNITNEFINISSSEQLNEHLGYTLTVPVLDEQFENMKDENGEPVFEEVYVSYESRDILGFEFFETWSYYPESGKILKTVDYFGPVIMEKIEGIDKGLKTLFLVKPKK